MIVIPGTVLATGMSVPAIPISPPTHVSPTIWAVITNSWIPDDHARPIVVGRSDWDWNNDARSNDDRRWYSNADVNSCLRFGGVQGSRSTYQAGHQERSCESHDPSPMSAGTL